MRDFRELKVWEKVHRLTLDVYRATQEFPREELYGITSQMRWASASIGANIAEGAGKNSRPESLSAQVVETKRMLTRFIQHLTAARTGTES